MLPASLLFLFSFSLLAWGEGQDGIRDYLETEKQLVDALPDPAALNDLTRLYKDQNYAIALFDAEVVALYGQPGADLEKLAKEASKGNAEAAFGLGVIYEYGLGPSPDFALARKYYEAAARKKHTMAINALGNMYYRGRGVDKDYAKAFAFYGQSGELYSTLMVKRKVQYPTDLRGLVYCAWGSGNMYSAGYVRGQDLMGSQVRWSAAVHTASDMNFYQLSYNMGISYLEGKNNAASAKHWFQQAAREGSEAAKCQAVIAETLLAEQQRAKKEAEEARAAQRAQMAQETGAAQETPAQSAPAQKSSFWEGMQALGEGLYAAGSAMGGNSGSYSSGASSSSGGGSTSSSSGSGSRPAASSSSGGMSMADSRNLTTDRNTYSSYETQLIKMNTYHESQYNDNTRRSIQNNMKTIRQKWEGRGQRMFRSEWESWDGRKR